MKVGLLSALILLIAQNLQSCSGFWICNYPRMKLTLGIKPVKTRNQSDIQSVDSCPATCSTEENIMTMNKLSETEKVLAHHLLSELYKEGFTQRSFPSNSGLLLVDHSSMSAIHALKHPGTSTVNSVPVDARDDCREAFIKSLSKPRGPNNQVDLLCTAGFRGSGKTIVQAFNCYWFTEETKGIAFAITFNSNQQDISQLPSVDAMDIRFAAASRMLHRCLAHLLNNPKKAENIVTKDKVVQLLKSSPLNSIKMATNVAKYLLSAPESVPVFLSVDELALCYVDSNITPSSVLSNLASILDSEDNIFLSVSVYDAADVAALCKHTNRKLLFQNLPPLLLYSISGVSPEAIRLMPTSLQPFFVTKLRDCLPHSDADVQLYSQLSTLVKSTVGHPRKLEKLFTELNHLDDEHSRFLLTRITNNSTGRAFVNYLHKVLHEKLSKIADEVDYIVSFPTDLSGLVAEGTAMTETEAFECIARDCALPFQLTDSSKNHDITLRGSSTGHCQLMQINKKQVLAQVNIANLGRIRFDKLLPCGEALHKLKSAIIAYVETVPSKGEESKALVKVLANSLLLFCRGNPFFTPASLCHEPLVGPDLSIVLSGGNIQIIEDIYKFPNARKSITGKDVKELVDKVLSKDPTSDGAIIVPGCKFTMIGDFYGLFRVLNKPNQWALISFQAKDWHVEKTSNKEPKQRVTLNQVWKKNCPKTVSFQSYSGTVEVKLKHILFTCNELSSSKAVEIGSNKGAASLVSMRKWLPTAAYAIQNARKLKSVFPSAMIG